MARKEITIRQFYGGISDDVRQTTDNAFAISQHFDIFSSPNRLTPFRNSEDEGVTSTQSLANFVYTNSKLYGLGVVSGTARVKIFEKSDPTAGSWAASTTGEDSGGTRQTNVFIDYKGKLMGWSAGTRIWSYTYGTSTWNGSERSGFTYSTTAQAFIHPADDVCYFPYDNKIAALNNTTWTDVAITVSSKHTITGLSQYGNYLAIACKSVSGQSNKSVLYLWDRNTAVTTLSEVIDWGEGDLVAVGNVDGNVIGISNVGGTSFSIAPKITIKAYSGGTPRQLKELSATSITCLSNPIISGDKMYFAVTGTGYNGIFCVGRKNQNYPLSVTLSNKYFNDTAAVASNSRHFYILGDYFFISNTSDTVSKTDDQSTYTATSIYESQKFSNNDPASPKQLFGVAVFYAPLPSSGQVVLKYRKDEETSYTTIFTDGVDNAIAHEAVNIESTGANLPVFKEIQFRIESTGGAEITGFKVIYDTNTDLLG